MVESKRPWPALRLQRHCFASIVNLHDGRVALIDLTATHGAASNRYLNVGGGVCASSHDVDRRAAAWHALTRAKLCSHSLTYASLTLLHAPQGRRGGGVYEAVADVAPAVPHTTHMDACVVYVITGGVVRPSCPPIGLSPPHNIVVQQTSHESRA